MNKIESSVLVVGLAILLGFEMYQDRHKNDHVAWVNDWKWRVGVTRHINDTERRLWAMEHPSMMTYTTNSITWGGYATNVWQTITNGCERIAR